MMSETKQPTMSRRAREAQPFRARVFGERADEMIARSISVIKLSLGEPDFGAPPAVRDAMREQYDGRALPYTAALGLPELRRAIADFYHERHHVDIDPRRIVITAGGSAALLLATALTVDPGDEVIVADPSYPCNRELIRSFEGVVVDVPTSAATRFHLNAELVDRAWSERTKAVMVTSPSNPTGTTICNSFSKFFGMTGWRLGWAVVPEYTIEAVDDLATNYYLCAHTPTQHAALACFTPESLAVCEERRQELLARRRIVVSGLERIGLPLEVVPNGAFYAYFSVAGTGLDAWTFCERALEEAHVALTPGRDFGPATADTHVRLSYAASREALTEGLSRLGKFVASLR